jgi:hypothetical protein
MLHNMGRLKLIASHVLTALAACALIPARRSAQVRGADELRPLIARISVPTEGAISLRRNPTLFTWVQVLLPPKTQALVCLLAFTMTLKRRR